MEITVSEFEGVAALIVLVGRFDINSADKIGMPLTALAGKKNRVVVDMAGVNFLASIGIRYLVQTAKAVAQADGKFILLKPNTMVANVLQMSGLTDILPIAQSDADARRLLNLPNLDVTRP